MNDFINPCYFSKNQIRELATIFAKSMNYVPIKSNLWDCVEKIGGKITYDNNKIDSIGGSISVKKKNDFTIYLSPVTGNQRNNFTIAHELGHYVLHSKLGKIPMEANREEDSHDLIEREANCFASEFLMPEEMIRKQFAKKNTMALPELANHFNVSISAMRWRCKNLGLL